jgi:serine/threonine protein kinase
MIGKTLGGYRIVEQVGMGGMATVYKAYQSSMERYVALKILPSHYAADPKFVRRFIREARTIAKLEHRNILPVHDFGEEDGVTYLAMRYLDGGTLKDMLAQGRPTLIDIAELMSQICAALDYAHRQGVVHRDVKPANIMIDDEGSVFLTDFGIAKALEGTAELTEPGVGIGTPAYMAPEQSLGKKVDGRTDIYALGVILYEMVVGRPPYGADTPMAVALAHIHEPLPLPRGIKPDIPEPIEAVIIKALSKDPGDRYQTANELAQAFKQALAESGPLPAETTLQMLLSKVRATRAAPPVRVAAEA